MQAAVPAVVQQISEPVYTARLGQTYPGFADGALSEAVQFHDGLRGQDPRSPDRCATLPGEAGYYL